MPSTPSYTPTPFNRSLRLSIMGKMIHVFESRTFMSNEITMESSNNPRRTLDRYLVVTYSVTNVIEEYLHRSRNDDVFFINLSTHLYEKLQNEMNTMHGRYYNAGSLPPITFSSSSSVAYRVEDPITASNVTVTNMNTLFTEIYNTDFMNELTNSWFGGGLIELSKPKKPKTPSFKTEVEYYAWLSGDRN